MVVRNTDLNVPYNPKTDAFETLSKVLVHDSARNKAIVADIGLELAKGKRVVAIWDEGNRQVVEVVTNNTDWAASTIAELYRARWQVEIFFREIKQLLHIKSFIGTSENAVMLQIWSALITIFMTFYVTRPKGPQSNRKVQMAPLQPGGLHQAEYVREDRPPTLAGPSL